jgi:SAM-dependent methyltransferase
LCGCDINPVYIQAATEFATSKFIDNTFRVINDDGTIPFANSSCDTVVSFDVLEHVDNVARCMQEMVRVLKPGGKLFAVFPQFYQPFESHLGFVTNMPGLQILIPPRVLSSAFRRELNNRADSFWYRPLKLEPWERLPTLNGITKRSFMRIVRNLPVDLVYENRDPILSKGRSLQWLRKLIITPALKSLLATRLLDEILLDRVAVVLVKKPFPTS